MKAKVSLSSVPFPPPTQTSGPGNGPLAMFSQGPAPALPKGQAEMRKAYVPGDPLAAAHNLVQRCGFS
jgi:hypothetical protein